MPLVVYLDETGDHSLELVDRDFPLFALVMLICDTNTYMKQIVPAFYELKFDYFGHEGVILHSRDIRKAQGDFGFLTHALTKQAFLGRVSQIMTLSITFALERLLPLLESAGQRRVQLVAEARGPREDDELQLSFLRVVRAGTEFVSAERFRNVDFTLEFKSKAMNIIGTQMADLAAYPIARHVLDMNKPNAPYDVVKEKFAPWGLKVFP